MAETAPKGLRLNALPVLFETAFTAHELHACNSENLVIALIDVESVTALLVGGGGDEPLIARCDAKG